MSVPSSAMIFAAGFGTRMRPLTESRPKPLVELMGRPLIDHALAMADAAGVRRKVVNAHYLADQIVTHLAGREDVQVIVEEEILDTGGGLVNALPKLEGEAIVTMNPDAILVGPNPIRWLVQSWDPAVMDALLLLVAPGNAIAHAGRGDFTADEGAGPATEPFALRRCRPGQAGWIYSGIEIMARSPLDPLPTERFSLNKVWDDLIATGRLFGATYPGRWVDVGTPEGLAAAETLLRSSEGE